jgi:integrase/recombinase XerD
MYACGLRIGEAATLEIGTIDSDNGLLRIIGKGNKERLVPLPEPMLSSLRRLWKTHKNPRWLFPTRAATNPVGRSTLNRTFAAAAQAAGIGSATPHSFATDMRHGCLKTVSRPEWCSWCSGIAALPRPAFTPT